MTHLQNIFLENMAIKANIKPYSMQHDVLMWRFSPEFRGFRSKAKNCENSMSHLIKTRYSEKSVTSIDATISKVKNKLCNAFAQELEESGISLDSLKRKKGKGRPSDDESSPWKIMFNWLWREKYPLWMENYVWNSFVQLAQQNHLAVLNPEWITFNPINIDGSKGGLDLEDEFEESNQIPIDTDLALQINIDQPDKYLLLIYSGAKNDGTIQKVLISPSRHFAPDCQLEEGGMLLPQHGAKKKKGFNFKIASTDEYIGILVNKPLDLPWLTPVPTISKLETQHLEKLWEQLENQDKKIFHREIEVIDFKNNNVIS